MMQASGALMVAAALGGGGASANGAAGATVDGPLFGAFTPCDERASGEGSTSEALPSFRMLGSRGKAKAAPKKKKAHRPDSAPKAAVLALCRAGGVDIKFVSPAGEAEDKKQFSVELSARIEKDIGENDRQAIKVDAHPVDHNLLAISCCDDASGGAYGVCVLNVQLSGSPQWIDMPGATAAHLAFLPSGQWLLAAPGDGQELIAYEVSELAAFIKENYSGKKTEEARNQWKEVANQKCEFGSLLVGQGEDGTFSASTTASGGGGRAAPAALLAMVPAEVQGEQAARRWIRP